MSPKKYFTKILSLFLCLVACQFFTINHVFAQATFQQEPRKIDLSSYVELNYNSRLIGFINSQTFVTARTTFDHGSSIDFWDTKSGRIISTILPPEPVYSGSVIISPDLRFIAGFQDVASYLPKPIYNPHKIFIWDLPSHHLRKTIDLGNQIHLDGAIFYPGKTNIMILTAFDSTGTNDRIIYLNLNTGKQEKENHFALARELHHNNIIFSSDGKTMVGVFPAIESSQGLIDIFNFFTGKLISSYENTSDDYRIDEPYFFLSNTQIVCNRFIYNIQTKHTALLLKPHDLRLKCVAGVPGKLGYTFFLSKQGLELWNLSADKMLKQWPQIKQATHIYFSADKSAMGIYNDKAANIQIWKFDPRLLGRR